MHEEVGNIQLCLIICCAPVLSVTQLNHIEPSLEYFIARHQEWPTHKKSN